MPTPESEMFLRGKPSVPPTFKDVDMKDYNAVVDARDAIIREQWVKIMMKRLVAEELGKCYRKEGVNHLEKCGKYRDRYLQLLKENAKNRGYMGQQFNYIPGVDGPEGGPEIENKFPLPQTALGAKGTDYRKGNTSGAGGNTLY